MVFMYTINSLKKGWWDAVTLIIWGATARLVGEDQDIQKKISQAMEDGVEISACKSCADQLGYTEKLEQLGIEVRYWGEPLTNLIKNGENLITI